MSAFTPQYPPASNPQQLAQQLFQVPAQTPQAPAPMPMNPTAGNPTNSGVGFPATAAQAAPVTSPPMYPVQPAPAYPAPQQPAYPMPQQPQPLTYQMPQQPALQQPAHQQPAAPAKAVINQLVQSNQLSAADATLFRSDLEFYNFLLDAANRANEPGPASQPTAPASPSPAPAQAPPAQTSDDFTRSLLSLQQSGAVTLENGRYVAKYPEFNAITERANMEQIKAQQALFELSDPKAWFKKHGQEVLQEAVTPLQNEIQRLRAELTNSIPQPHEAWIAKNESKLRSVDPMTGQPVLTQAGMVYDSVYKDLQRYGTRDPRALHEGAARAAEAVMAAVPAAQPQQQASPMTFMQAAAASPLPPTPGFNLPGTQLSRAQPNQYSIPVTNQRTVDFRAIGEGILSGQIPREF